jgi:hypothetical protein
MISSLQFSKYGKGHLSNKSHEIIHMANISLIYPEKILNIPSQEVLDVMNFAYDKMEDPTSKILAISWKVGSFISDGGFVDKPFSAHKVLLSQEKIESIITQTGAWIDQAVIEKGEPEGYRKWGVKDSELNSLRLYLEGGADASMQLNIGPDIRLIYMAQTEGMTTEPNYLTFVLHELYHALQKDIAIESYTDLTENNPESNAKWLSEGAAEYFAEKTYQELNESYSGSNKFLSEALGSYLEDNSTALINGAAIASRGAAALSLMVQKGLLQESLILDGSLFHNSTTETDYLDANPHILDAKKNWFKIIVDNGNYGFSTEALEGGILNTGDDTLKGGASNDTLNGNAGNDTIFADGGSDTIKGGTGLDTIKYTLAQANYTLTVGETNSTVKEISTDTNDSFSTIERIVFADNAVALDIDGANSAGGIYRTYKAAFNRTPEKTGFGYWIDRADNGASAVQMAEEFVWSAEFQTLYGVTTSDNYLTGNNIEAVVDLFYRNVLGRTPDQGGLTYYTSTIEDQNKTGGQVLAEIADSAENRSNLLSTIETGMSYDLWLG